MHGAFHKQRETLPIKAMSSGEAIYLGVKPFWRTRTNCDVTIVDYPEFDTVEVISYESSFDREAPRLYLSSAYIAKTMNASEIELKLVAEKEAQLRRHCTPDEAQIRSDILKKFKIDYILNRLQIVEFLPAIKSFRVELKLNYRDDEVLGCQEQKMNAVIEKHPGLVPFKSPCLYKFSMYKNHLLFSYMLFCFKGLTSFYGLRFFAGLMRCNSQ
jgi:hypothetical protein